MRCDEADMSAYVSLRSVLRSWETQWRAFCDGLVLAQWSTMCVAKLKDDGRRSGETGRWSRDMMLCYEGCFGNISPECLSSSKKPTPSKQMLKESSV